ncbi:MAG: hypothetical protein GY797_09310 [Deltaproteobacteria bacterium]|nr:hypothetical protein [Deltaproteobacteria bacterium]
MHKYDMIENAERQFAREVTLGVIVTSPLAAWQYIIPGYFIIDFLRRSRAIRQYTKYFMFPRKLAMDMSVAQMQGENKASMSSDFKDTIRIWLESLKLYSPDLEKALVGLIEILAAHYLKLLSAEGDTFYVLLKHAYPYRDHFKQFIETITSVENEVDRLVTEQLGSEKKGKEKILAQQQQISKRRQKILEDVF